MTQSNDDAANRFLPRIREELDKLPLTEEEKDQLIVPLLKNAAFLDTHGGSSESGKLQENSPAFAFSEKLQAVVHAFQDDGLTFKKLLTAATKNPVIFAQSPETIIRNIKGAVDRFRDDGVTTKAYLKAALKAPSLFQHQPETVCNRIAEVTQLFAEDGLSREAYVQAALRNPPLFTQSPDTIKRNITGVVDRFAADGLDQATYLRAALVNPVIFSMTPETIATNITGVVDHFAEKGMTTRAYLEAALKHSTLFLQSPSTINRHIETVIGFYDEGIFRPPRSRSSDSSSVVHRSEHYDVIEFLLKKPRLLGLADDNFALREYHQKMTNGPTNTNFLRTARHKVERELMQHLGHDDPARPVPYDGFVAGQDNPTDEQAKRLVLRALMHAGLIKGGSMER